MPIPKRVLAAILDEQERQSGLFVPEGDDYFDKLSAHAELVMHERAGELLGYAFFYCNDPEKSFSYISLIGSSATARGTGVGHALLQYVLAITLSRGFSGCRLEVRKDNLHAIQFYERAGFVKIEDRGDKLLMHLDLPK